MKTAVQLSDLTKFYGDFKAVNGLDLTVHKGELFGFLGPNGAGKTTTIKMMTGLLEPTSGMVQICGIDLWQQPLRAKAKLAYVPDEPYLFPKLTGWELLRFVASVYRVPSSVFHSRAEELLDLFNLTNRAGELIESYSYGMKKKIALCAALVHKPEVLFLDEPTVGLDPGSARSLKMILRRVCEEGAAVFMSTHILEIAEQMCDRVGIIQEGNLIALGTMDALRSQHQGASLEDIFLQLTGGEEAAKIIASLSEEGNEAK
ncbi:MAG: ABC transporter ATP-binding protein [Peptococcaceae bacterium]|nr:ABC transporter ATP-binding protein [Peptococcaceae bacterium]